VSDHGGSRVVVERHEVTAMSVRERAVYRCIRWILEVWCRVFWRMEVQGRDRLPATGPFIVAPVHRSYIDFAVIGAAVPRVMRFMGKDSIWTVSWLARILDHMGAFPVNRERVDRAALRNCEEALALGDPLVMFPEGRRREGPVVEDLQEGPAWVACRHRVPIVPVGLGNTDRAMPIGAKWLRPVRIRVVIGEPIYPDVPVHGRVPRGSVAALTEQLRDEVQRTYDRSTA
jgi:1-acyl-sn-glycerol-3-phosphate acyltransferase